MKTRSAALPSLAICLLVWAFFSWPLPKMAADGIPSSARNTETEPARAMIPGDHLQFFYHFTLVSHFADGRAPLFHNVYEFNRGDDGERRAPGPYYAPFSLVFAALSPLTGPAAAWNITGLLSLWLTLWATWALLRRYVKDPWIAAAAALVSIVLPFRWTTLAGGSPTGLGMMWVPVALLGFERFIVDGRARGAFLAGLAVYFSSWVDDHVFFFVSLGAMPWMAFAWCMQRERIAPASHEITGRIKAAWPLLLFALPSLLQVLGTSRRLSGTDIGGGGRPLHEVSIFSPRMSDSLVFWKAAETSEIYLGVVLLLLLGAGLAAALGGTGRRSRRLAAGLVAVLAGTAFIVLLASGTNNPFGKDGWRALTALVPPYGMIRNPTKVYILMPVLLSVGAALAAKAVFRGTLSGRHRVILLLALLAVLVDFRTRLSVQVCLLDETQDAYAAVAADASAAGAAPRIIALPLWPGNSHWTSVNQYYAALYGVRMINGYKPTVPSDYRREVFDVFEQLNKGSLPDELLDGLLAMGIRHVVLHEDAWPEKVSPFGVSHTIAALLGHPRISLLEKDRNVWAFRIEDGERRGYFPLMPWRHRSSSRIWEIERYGPAEKAFADPAASGGSYLRLAPGGGSVAMPFTSLPRLDGMGWMVRLRGYGAVEITVSRPEAAPLVHGLAVSGDSWDWVALPLPADGAHGPLSLGIRPLTGAVDADVAGVFMPIDELPLGGSRITLAPSVLFHQGHTNLERQTVVLSPERVPADRVLYGPRLPLQAGRYSLEISSESDAPEGTLLGHVTVGAAGGATAPLVAGLPWRMDFAHGDNLLFSLAFDYARSAAVEIGAVTLRRVE